MRCGAECRAGRFPAPVLPPIALAQSRKAVWVLAGSALIILAIPVLAVIAAIVIPDGIGQRIQSEKPVKEIKQGERP